MLLKLIDLQEGSIISVDEIHATSSLKRNAVDLNMKQA